MSIMFILRFSLGGKNNRWTRRSELCKDGHGLFFPRSAIVIPLFKGGTFARAFSNLFRICILVRYFYSAIAIFLLRSPLM